MRTLLKLRIGFVAAMVIGLVVTACAGGDAPTSTPPPTTAPASTSAPGATPTSVATSAPAATPTSVATSAPAATPTSVATSAPAATPTSVATSAPAATPTPVATSAPAATATPIPGSASGWQAPAWVSEGEYGGTLRLFVSSDATDWDVHQSGSLNTTQKPSGRRFNQLVEYDPVNPTQIIGDLAQDWSVGPDGKTYTFNCTVSTGATARL